MIDINVFLDQSMKTFYRLPVWRPELLKVWLQKLHLDEKLIKMSTTYVCGEHFLPTMFTEGSIATKRRCLKADAVPTG